MTPAELTHPEIAELTQDLRQKGEPFAIATVIRTVGATAAKPGAKAVLLSDGEIAQGWIGGGCVRAALKRAASQSLVDGQPQLISLNPQEVLEERGIAAGEDQDGVRFARNGCPSKGSMDIFVEPILPLPELVIFGESPVAEALRNLAGGFQWAVSRPGTNAPGLPLSQGARRMIVVATQGRDDVASLRRAVETEAEFRAFVGSHRKFAALSERLVAEGADAERLASVQAPAGLHIHAVTPEEIALSILAQLTGIRRCAQRGDPDD